MTTPINKNPVFDRPEHKAVIEALHQANITNLTNAKCLFGGGTAIVLAIGEYRVSKDIDFLCADQDGYRDIRSRVTKDGITALFRSGVKQLRDFRFNQYGMRTVISYADTPIRLEIVREGRIDLENGVEHPRVPVLILTPDDQLTEKLLANADRGQERATAYRDAIDLGMLIAHRGPFTKAAIQKAEAAYGTDIRRKAQWVTRKLTAASERQHVAATLEMSPTDVDVAATALSKAVSQLWPTNPSKQPNRHGDTDFGL